MGREVTIMSGTYIHTESVRGRAWEDMDIVSLCMVYSSGVGSGGVGGSLFGGGWWGEGRGGWHPQ